MSSISSIGGNGAMTMQHMKRPDPTQMAEKLFSKLDTSGQGYLTKADLQSAMDGTSASSSSGSSNIDNLFSKLDGDGDGKVTKQEFSDTLKKIADELGSQAMRANGGMQGSGMGGGMSGMGGMPPGGMPPGGGMPTGGDSGGMTKDQLSSAASSSTDSAETSALTNLVNNFDKADTDSDGEVSFKEAMDYKQKTESSGSTSTSASSSSTSSTSSSNNRDSQVLQQIMKLMQAYGINNQTDSNSLLSTLSVTA